MRLFRFDKESGRQISPFGSHGLTLAPIARPDGSTQLGCFYLDPGSVVGFHEATVAQLFLVVHGSGWVRGAEESRTPIRAGQAAFWTAGEWHESGSATGMIAFVLEAENLEPTKFMVAI